MLSISNLSVEYAGAKIVADFGVSLFATCALNIYGANGSGKSSILRRLVGLDIIKPKQVFYDQIDVFNHLPEYRLMNEYVGHNLGLKEDLTVLDNLSFWAKLYDNELLIPSAVRTFRLDAYLEHKISELSYGTKKRSALARLLVTNSTLWFLDEPFANLDAEFKDIMLNLIRARCEQKGIVVFTSHDPMQQKYITNFCIEDFKYA
jgi:heme exporter protein A